MALPDFTTQDPPDYKANIDATAQDHEDRLDVLEDKSAVFADLQSAQSIPGGGSFAAVQFDTEQFDLKGEFDTANGRFTPTEEGYYWVYSNVTWATSTWSGGESCYIWVEKSGSSYCSKTYKPHSLSSQWSMDIGAMVYCNGTTDYIEINVQNGHTSARSLFSGGQRTAVSIHRVL